MWRFGNMAIRGSLTVDTNKYENHSKRKYLGNGCVKNYGMYVSLGS